MFFHAWLNAGSPETVLGLKSPLFGSSDRVIGIVYCDCNIKKSLENVLALSAGDVWLFVV
jgi:hypothetical protein